MHKAIYPSGLPAGGVMSYRFRAAARLLLICAIHMSKITGRIFFVRMSIDFSILILVHRHSDLFICSINNCPLATTLWYQRGPYFAQCITLKSWTDVLRSKLCGLTQTCSCATLGSFAYLPTRGLSVGQKLAKAGTSTVQTWRSSYPLPEFYPF